MSGSRTDSPVLAIACSLLPTLACAAQVPPDASTVDITPQRLTADFHVIDESALHGGSISVLTGPDGVLIVDTGVAALAPRVAAEIGKLSPKSIRYVINTHAHVDETGGNEYFGRLGATIVARAQVRDSLRNPRAPTGNAQRQARQSRPPAPAVALPTVTFTGDMNLRFNGQEIRLIATPRAHTDGDTLIHLPGLDIIVAGDVLRAHEFPSIGRPDGGTLPGMLDALAKLIALAGPGTRIVTSHGAIVDRSVAVAQRDFLLTARDRIAALLAKGRTIDEVIAADVTGDLGVRALPGHIGADAFVRDVYAELLAVPAPRVAISM